MENGERFKNLFLLSLQNREGQREIQAIQIYKGSDRWPLDDVPLDREGQREIQAIQIYKGSDRLPLDDVPLGKI